MLIMFTEAHRPLYETISTEGLSMGIDKRWGGFADKAACFHLDCVAVLYSLQYRAEERRDECVVDYVKPLQKTLLMLCYVQRKHCI